MTWGIVVEVIGTHRCIERVRYGRCNCRTGKGLKCYNPCERAEKLMVEAERLAEGQGDAEVVLKFLHRKTCGLSRHGRGCNHRGCIAKEQAQDFVLAATRKAAG